MARIRSIKPEFFLHEELAELSAYDRLLFIGLWTLADKKGRLQDRPKRIKAALFPWDELDIEDSLCTLDDLGFIHRYEADGKACIAIPKFLKHQRPHPKETACDLPEPPERQKPLKKPASREIKRQASLEVNSSFMRPAGKEILDSGKEIWEGTSPAPKQQPLVLAADPQETRKLENEADRVFDHWKEVMGLNARTSFDSARRTKVEARLNDGYSVDDLKKAIEGCSKTPHNQGHNDTGQKHLGLDLICKNASQVDRFIANAANPPRLKAGSGAATAADTDWSGPAPKTRISSLGIEELDLG